MESKLKLKKNNIYIYKMGDSEILNLNKSIQNIENNLVNNINNLQTNQTNLHNNLQNQINETNNIVNQLETNLKLDTNILNINNGEIQKTSTKKCQILNIIDDGHLLLESEENEVLLAGHVNKNISPEDVKKYFNIKVMYRYQATNFQYDNDGNFSFIYHLKINKEDFSQMYIVYDHIQNTYICVHAIKSNTTLPETNISYGFNNKYKLELYPYYTSECAINLNKSSLYKFTIMSKIDDNNHYIGKADNKTIVVKIDNIELNSYIGKTINISLIRKVLAHKIISSNIKLDEINTIYKIKRLYKLKNTCEKFINQSINNQVFIGKMFDSYATINTNIDYNRNNVEVNVSLMDVYFTDENINMSEDGNYILINDINYTSNKNRYVFYSKIDKNKIVIYLNYKISTNLNIIGKSFYINNLYKIFWVERYNYSGSEYLIHSICNDFVILNKLEDSSKIAILNCQNFTSNLYGKKLDFKFISFNYYNLA